MVYYFEDCAYYILTHFDLFYGNIVFREFKNAIMGEVVRNRYVGREISQEFIEASRMNRAAVPPTELPKVF